ncbi:MAG: hypothetical protein IJU76_05035 [Desulfovibrionaceae bacterium]|nr:hypothetical protein [Desulfovibrionaceae bacterium]
MVQGIQFIKKNINLQKKDICSSGIIADPETIILTLKILVEIAKFFINRYKKYLFCKKCGFFGEI